MGNIIQGTTLFTYKCADPLEKTMLFAYKMKRSGKRKGELRWWNWGEVEKEERNLDSLVDIFYGERKKIGVSDRKEDNFTHALRERLF